MTCPHVCFGVCLFLFAGKDPEYLFEESKNLKLMFEDAKYTAGDSGSCYQNAVGLYSKGKHCLKHWLIELMKGSNVISRDQMALSETICRAYAYLANWSICAGYTWGGDNLDEDYVDENECSLEGFNVSSRVMKDLTTSGCFSVED
jgi:hypothetical protein